ncbi:MAG: HAD family phosphatase [Proteobacteria bacterium]|nr:HAD family phosphatase [Pseudomonadota bacterium]MBI3496010.1 HAD family phosphatase [Pseudomonadota bacterium]
MPSIALVLFDLDDVLCSYDRPAHIARIAALAGKQPEDVHRAIWASGFDAEADAGAFDADQYLRGIHARIGYKLTRLEWVAGRKATTRPAPAVLALVKTVALKARVAVLTNNTTLVTDHIDEFLPELRSHFGEAVYASAELGAAKPDAEAYRRCLARLDMAPAETLFIDDLEENVAGARQAGLQAHRHTSLDALTDVLRHHRML